MKLLGLTERQASMRSAAAKAAWKALEQADAEPSLPWADARWG
ncbi:MAG: hypothetical protein ABIQ66_11120 [Novosphingobium sp.]